MLKQFSKKYLMEELDLPYESKYVVKDTISDTGRWVIYHDLIFLNPRDNKFYETSYQVGATECQDESPWEYENEVACWEVKPRNKIIKTWVREEDEDFQKNVNIKEKTFLSQRIVYFYSTQDWKKERFNDLVSYYTDLALLEKCTNTSNEAFIHLKDGSSITFFPISENARGLRYNKVIFEEEPNEEFYYQVVKPCMTVPDKINYSRLI